jgi:hypothetical protein
MILQWLTRKFGQPDRQAGNRNRARYLAYAFGEITLIVIGILIALYVDQWNENRKQEQQFRDSMERVYNAVLDDLGLIERQLNSIILQLEIIDTLLRDPEAYDDRRLVQMLYFLDQPRVVWAQTAWSAVRQDPSVLETNAADDDQLNLVEQLADYLDNMSHDEAALSFGIETAPELIAPVLRNAGIPNPAHLFGRSESNDFAIIDLDFFSADEIDRVRTLIRNGSLSTPLRSLRARKSEYLEIAARRRDVARSMARSIKTAYATVRLHFDDISIVGPALDADAAAWWINEDAYQDPPENSAEDIVHAYYGWSAHEASMTRVDESDYLWELDIQLYDGLVKFRSRGSWDENWGGNTFPTGRAVRHGDNISVTEGRYRIVLDLERQQYEFIRLD